MWKPFARHWRNTILILIQAIHLSNRKEGKTMRHPNFIFLSSFNELLAFFSAWGKKALYYLIDTHIYCYRKAFCWDKAIFKVLTDIDFEMENFQQEEKQKSKINSTHQAVLLNGKLKLRFKFRAKEIKYLYNSKPRNWMK